MQDSIQDMSGKKLHDMLYCYSLFPSFLHDRKRYKICKFRYLKKEKYSSMITYIYNLYILMYIHYKHHIPYINKRISQ